MNVFQKYTLCTVVSIFCMFGAFYCLVNRYFIPLFILVLIGLIAGVLRMYYKHQRLHITNPDKVAIETLAELNKRK